MTAFFFGLPRTKFGDVVREVVEDAYLDNPDGWEDYTDMYCHLRVGAWLDLSCFPEKGHPFDHPRLEGDRHELGRRLTWFAVPAFSRGLLRNMPPADRVARWLELREELLPILGAPDRPLVLLACRLLATLSRFERLRASPPDPELVRVLHRWWRSPHRALWRAAGEALAHLPLLPRDTFPPETWGDCDAWLREPAHGAPGPKAIDAMSIQAAYVVAWYRRGPWTDDELAAEIGRRSAARLNAPTARDLLAQLGAPGRAVLEAWGRLDERDRRPRPVLPPAG